MSNTMGIPSHYGLENHGLRNLTMEYWTLPTPALVEQIISRREGVLAHEGAIVVRTGVYTGRAPNDKYIVSDLETAERVNWSKINQPLEPARFHQLHLRMIAYLQGRDVFVQDTTICAHPRYRLPIRVITESAWHSLFARNVFIRRQPQELADHVPQFTVLHAPRFRAIPELDGLNSDVFIILNFTRRMALIGGTGYAGEIKKAMFTAMNYLLPQQDVLPMHCSATVGEQGDVALFFGLSGTGKTTLSSDPQRKMVGDDEHGWGEEGIFNFEGGCYAKVIRLSQEYEPLIWKATRHFGTVIENAAIDSYTRRIDFNDDSYTENTRAAYPIGFLDNIVPSGVASHPKNIFFLTADAYGVLPPIARLDRSQAIYYFLSGYTSKLAGTEKGLGKEPQATFSACFGAPFMPLHPARYAQMLAENLQKHDVRVWLVNTGWTGGPYGIGQRMPLPYTRAMVAAAMEGKLADVPYQRIPVFNLEVPQHCPEVPDELLVPRNTWQDVKAYDEAADRLAVLFRENFRQFEPYVDAKINLVLPLAY